MSGLFYLVKNHPFQIKFEGKGGCTKTELHELAGSVGSVVFFFMRHSKPGVQLPVGSADPASSLQNNKFLQFANI